MGEKQGSKIKGPREERNKMDEKKSNNSEGARKDQLESERRKETNLCIEKRRGVQISGH